MTAWLWSLMSDEQRAACSADLMLDASPPLRALVEANERWIVRYADGSYEVRQGLWPTDVTRGLKLGGGR